MEVFTWTPDYSYSQGIEFKTEITVFESGVEQRRARRGLPTRNFNLKYELLDDDEAEAIRNFYIARYGAYEAFLYRNYPNEYQVVDEAVDTGNGVTTVFYLDKYPVIASEIATLSPPSSAPIIKVAGVTQTLTTDYTLSRDDMKLTFLAAPSGAITATYDYYTRVRFADDNLSSELFSYKLYKMGINLKEVLL